VPTSAFTLFAGSFTGSCTATFGSFVDVCAAAADAVALGAAEAVAAGVDAGGGGALAVIAADAEAAALVSSFLSSHATRERAARERRSARVFMETAG
jgi:hypothetical protein